MKKNRTLSYYEYHRLLEGGRMLCWYRVVHERYGNWDIRELLVVAGLGNRRCLSEYE